MRDRAGLDASRSCRRRRARLGSCSASCASGVVGSGRPPCSGSPRPPRTSTVAGCGGSSLSCCCGRRQRRRRKLSWLRHLPGLLQRRRRRRRRRRLRRLLLLLVVWTGPAPAAAAAALYVQLCAAAAAASALVTAAANTVPALRTAVGAAPACGRPQSASVRGKVTMLRASCTHVYACSPLHRLRRRLQIHTPRCKTIVGDVYAYCI